MWYYNQQSICRKQNSLFHWVDINNFRVFLPFNDSQQQCLPGWNAGRPIWVMWVYLDSRKLRKIGLFLSLEITCHQKSLPSWPCSLDLEYHVPEQLPAGGKNWKGGQPSAFALGAEDPLCLLPLWSYSDIHLFIKKNSFRHHAGCWRLSWKRER